MIHHSALIDPRARIDDGVSIGPFSVIGPDVEIGAGSEIGSHCSINGPTRIGKSNRIHAHAVLGGSPQDKKYKGEATQLIVGDGNTFREFTTVSRGTSSSNGDGATRIGDHNWFMAYVHVAHDCVVGNHCVLANNATLAGHVAVGDFVILSGFAGVHQFCRIGDHAFIGMGCMISGDVAPFVIVADRYAKPRGVNVEGLKRRGFDNEQIMAIKRAFRVLFLSGAPLAEIKLQLAESAAASNDVAKLLAFIEKSERGLLR